MLQGSLTFPGFSIGVIIPPKTEILINGGVILSFLHVGGRCLPLALQEVSVLAEKSTIEAVKKALESSKQRKFEESVELAINLRDVDLSVPKNRIEEEVILPKGRGKDIKIAIFASGELAFKSKDQADLIITPEEIEGLAKDKKKLKSLVSRYNFFLAEAPLMPTIGRRLGVVLGPRGKMPKPVSPAVDPKGIIANLRRTVRLRSRDRRTFHSPIGSSIRDASVSQAFS
jgi:large subunit ribosomal protein L1